MGTFMEQRAGYGMGVSKPCSAGMLREIAASLNEL